MGKPHPFIKGFWVTPKGYYDIYNSSGQRLLVECECHKKFMKDVRNFDVYEKANIPFTFKNFNIDKEYKGKDVNNNIKKLKTYIDKFESSEFSSAILYFYGRSGTQKTFTAKWLGAQIINKSKKVAYITMLDLISLLLKPFDDVNVKKPEDTYSGFLDKADLVIIDDSFDKSRVSVWKSGYQLQFLDSFLRKRLGNKKGLVIISEYCITDISSQGFSPSIQDLISREVNLKKTAFEFTDNYEVNILDPKGLFDDEIYNN